MLCGLSLDIDLSFSLLASFVCVFTNPNSSELYCVHGPFWLPLYLMGTSIFNSPDKRHYFSFAQFRVFQERMLIVHFILKAMAWGIWAGLPGCCLSDVWVRRTEGRPWKTNLTKNITWRHATYTLCNQNDWYFPSYFSCRNKNLYHDSSFSMIFNVVRNISFEWRWLKHNISGVLFRNSCYSFMLSPNIYLQIQALFSAFQRCGRF